MNEPSAAIRDDAMPARARYDAPRWVSSVQPTPFGSFTEQLTLTTSKPVDVYFRLPPDLYLAAQPFVPLHLRFMFTGNGQPATLHVRLNGSDVGSLALSPTSSNEPRDEIVRVPTHQFHQYGNTLSFVLTRDASSSSDDLSIRIAPDSTIDLHRLPHSVAQPQLGLVVDAGYPFTAQPDLSGTAVVLSTRPTMREYETVLNMAGVFGAETGVAATGVTIADARHIDQVRGKDLIVLGGPIAQPLLSVWSNVMPLGLTAAGPVINDAARSTPRAHPMWPFGDSDRERLARLIGAGYTFDAVLEQFASPYRPDRSVVVIVPGDDGGAFAAKTFSH